MVYKEEKANKGKPDRNVQVELAISRSCAPSKKYSFYCGYKTDYLVEAQYILSEGFIWFRDFTFLNIRSYTDMDSVASTDISVPRVPPM